MEKIQKYLPTPLVLLAFLLSFITIYGTGSPIFNDADIGWHIAAGDLIRESGTLPLHDTWSFSSDGQIWYNMSWLWDIVLSFVHEKFGVEGLFIFAVFCSALLVAMLLASLRKNADIGINATIFMGMITTYCMLEFANARPQIVGMFFALFFYNILYASRNNPKIWKLFLLPLIMVLWVNIHGSFFVGFIVIGAYGLEAIYSKNKVWFWRLFLIGALCVLALLINPYGINIVTAVMRTLNTVIAKYVVEWRPFVFGNSMGVSLWLLVFVLFSNLRGSNTLIADKILAIAWLVAMLFSVRNIGMLAILGAPYLAANLPADNQKDSNTRKLSVWINDLRFSPAVIALALSVVVSSYFLLPVLGTEHYLEKKKNSPLNAIDYITQNYAGKRVLNDYDFGGIIIYKTKGKLPVFIDGRAGTAYSEKILTDFIAFFDLSEGWQDIMESYKVDVVFLKNTRPFVKNYENGAYYDTWQKVFSDDVATVYIKK